MIKKNTDDEDFVFINAPPIVSTDGRPSVIQRPVERKYTVFESVFSFIPFWLRIGFWLAVFGLVSFVLLHFPGGFNPNGLILGLASLGALVFVLIICASLDRCIERCIRARRYTDEMEIVIQDDPLYGRDPSLFSNRKGKERIGQLLEEEVEESCPEFRDCFRRFLRHELGWCVCVTVTGIIFFIGGWLLAYRFIGKAPMQGLLASNGFWGHY